MDSQAKLKQQKIFKVTIAKIIYLLATQRMVWRPAVSELSENLLKMQNSRSHPRLSESELHFDILLRFIKVWEA